MDTSPGIPLGPQPGTIQPLDESWLLPAAHGVLAWRTCLPCWLDCSLSSRPLRPRSERCAGRQTTNRSVSRENFGLVVLIDCLCLAEQFAQKHLDVAALDV